MKIYFVVLLMVLSTFLFLPSYEQSQQVKFTSGDTLKVGFSTNPETPIAGSQIQLEIYFLNKESNLIQQQVDYKVSIREGNNQVLGIPVTHTATGMASIPFQPQDAVAYQVIVEVYGVSFQPIPTETVSFSLPVESQVNTIFLDKSQYTWTDKVKITIIAPDQNLDPNKIDTIGNITSSKLTISTPGNSISSYALVETGPNTGIFTGSVILTGDPNIKGPMGVDGKGTNPTGAGPSGIGPTDGLLPAENNRGISVLFQTSNQTITASALIRWNTGQISWLPSNYTTNGRELQIIDPDMHLNPGTIDSFLTPVWSNSDLAGVMINMTETGPDTGIFRGTVYFTNETSSDNKLHLVSGNNTITAEYNDRTLSGPHTPADQFRFNATTNVMNENPRVLSSIVSNLNVTGNTIVISGTVTSIINDTPLSVFIFDPHGDLVFLGQTDVSQDGKFGATVQAVGVLWQINGTYTVKLQYGSSNNTAQTTFTFPSPIPTNTVFLENPTIKLDKSQYTWTDKANITVVAPDQNLDPNKIDTIGNTTSSKIIISTRGHHVSSYNLVETGPNTGIFTGTVTLTGDPLIKGNTGVDGYGTHPTGAGPSGIGPSDGILPAQDNDGISVSLQTQNQTVTASAPIRWNLGSISWSQPDYPVNGQGVLKIVDPDMNLNPKAIESFYVNVWSDSDSGGIKLTMTETGENTGIFQGTVYFTTNFQSSGNRLHVAEGDPVTGEYRDRTLPPPYTPSDQLRLTSTTFIGTIVPPLERAPASNPRVVDPFGNLMTSPVNAGQPIQIIADLTNSQNRDQPFAYVVQIQDANGVTVSLSWITGTLTAGQSLNPAQSWTPQYSGTYTAKIFVLQSIDNPLPISKPLTTTIPVQGGKSIIYDTIPVSLSGTVKPPVQNDTATLLILDPNNEFVQIAQTNVTNDSKFSTTIKAGGPNFRVTGNYTVEVEYGGILQNNLHFNYTNMENSTHITFSGFGNATQVDVSITPGSGSSAVAGCVVANNCFSPNPLNVTSGTTVTWTNYDRMSHTITSGKVTDDSTGSLFDSGLLKPGKTFQYTFAHTGTFDYVCVVHPWMTGQVTVSDPVNKSTSTSIEVQDGSIIGLSSSNSINNLQVIPDSSLTSVGKPSGTFPFELLSWKITGLAIGQTVPVNFTYPSPLPDNVQYWKFNNGTWTNLSSLIAGIHGNVLTINITDGGLGDSDGLANGIISDPGGILIPSLPTPHSGGSTPGSPPSFTTGFDNGEYPLTINGVNYNLENYSNVGQTVTVQTGQHVAMKLLLEGDQGPSSVKHVSIFTDLHGPYISLFDSDASIAWDSGQPITISDPNHYFSTVTANATTYNGKLAVLFDVTFAKPMMTSDIGFRVWGNDLYSKDTYLVHALGVVPAQAISSSVTPLTPDQNTNSTLFSAPSTVIPSEPTMLQPDITQSIKEWGGYSSTSISDSELLNDMGIKASHVPAWTEKTTKFVVNGEVTGQNFENMIKYLYSVGIIK